MKTSKPIAFLFCLSLLPVAFAATEATPDKKQTETQMMSMDKQMESMRSMHEKMMNAKTDDERKALMKDHMKTMKDSMSMMQSMHGTGSNGMPMMGKGEMKGGMMMNSMMDKRMDMMEMMMQMMMDQMNANPAK